MLSPLANKRKAPDFQSPPGKSIASNLFATPPPVKKNSRRDREGCATIKSAASSQIVVTSNIQSPSPSSKTRTRTIHARAKGDILDGSTTLSFTDMSSQEHDSELDRRSGKDKKKNDYHFITNEDDDGIDDDNTKISGNNNKLMVVKEKLGIGLEGEEEINVFEIVNIQHKRESFRLSFKNETVEQFLLTNLQLNQSELENYTLKGEDGVDVSMTEQMSCLDATMSFTVTKI